MTDLDRWFTDLCKQHRIKASRSPDGTWWAQGKRGEIYDHGPGVLAWCYMGGSRNLVTRILRKHSPEILTVNHLGDGEFVFTFSPSDLPSVARLCRISLRPNLSNEERARLRLVGVRLAALNATRRAASVGGAA